MYGLWHGCAMELQKSRAFALQNGSSGQHCGSKGRFMHHGLLLRHDQSQDVLLGVF